MKKLIDWKTYAVHTDQEIRGFFGDYRWLSNFHECPVVFDGIMYQSSEAAYMAAKTLDKNIRREIIALPPKEARKLGRSIVLRPNWEEIKLDVMFLVVFDKFSRNPELKQKLINTEKTYLEEANAWGDRFWGVSYKGFDGKLMLTGIGENNLGKILMRIRSIWQ